MNKLPKVFANPINKDIINEQKLYRSDRKNSSTVSINEIDNLLNSNRHIYRSKVKINGEVKVIIKRVGDYLLAIDNEKINIHDINSFETI
ncbi:MAG: hypothetical protein IKX00_05010 [Bacilli bacterium]|nr:hypothetical protein [Bacilli bacterium]